jgi:5-hydroxyisourate hydrolase-like protein (transthyretin family)
MSAGRPKKCMICGESIIGEEGILYKNNRFVHSKCFQSEVKNIAKEKQKQLNNTSTNKRGRKPKPQAELKDGLSEEEYNDKKTYYEYIKQLMNNESDEPFDPKIYAISTNINEKYGIPWKWMYLTLVYMNEIIEYNFDFKKGVVGLIPYYYSQTKKFYEELDRIETNNKDLNTDGMYKETTIYIKRPKRPIKQLSVEDIGE